MLSYAGMRDRAQSGDKLFVKQNLAVRALTGESYSHVAVLVWIDSGLWAYEFVEKVGFQAMPASQWFELRKGQTLFYGQAPEQVRENPEAVEEVCFSFRDYKKAKRSWIRRLWDRTLGRLGYGYLSLPVVWAAQLLGREFKVRQLVCSTFAQKVDERAGFRYRTTADPGDIAQFCILYPVAS